MKINTDESVICQNENRIHNYFAWPSVTRLPDGMLAMVASGFRLRHVCPFGKGVICYSGDEGWRWTLPAVVIDTPLDDRDCGIAVFGRERNRVIVTSFNNSRGMQQESNGIQLSGAGDGGKRYRYVEAYLDLVEDDDERNYLGSTYRLSEDGGYTFGRIKRVPVTAPHGPCVMPDGSLLYVGTKFGSPGILEAWKMEAEGEEFVFVSSLDTSAIPKEFEPCEPHAVWTGNRVLVQIRVQGKNYFSTWQCDSVDGGESFRNLHPVLKAQEGAPPHLLLHSSGILISVYGHRRSPYGIHAVFSNDGGDSWSEPYTLYDKSPSEDCGYPCSTELSDGRILTVFYAREENGKNTVIHQSIWQLPSAILNSGGRRGR